MQLASRRRPLFPTLLMGAWAAAIAVAPNVRTKLVLAAPALVLPLIWWTLDRPSRWLTAFLVTALLLPPLPIPIGDSGPHPSLFFAALGLLAGLLWLGEWRVRLSSLSTALTVLFSMLLASIAAAAALSGATVA